MQSSAIPSLPIAYEPGRIAQSVARLTEESGVPGLILGPTHTFVETVHGIFSTVILTLPQIH